MTVDLPGFIAFSNIGSLRSTRHDVGLWFTRSDGSAAQLFSLRRDATISLAASGIGP